MVELLKKIIHKSLEKLCSVQTVNAKTLMSQDDDSCPKNEKLVKA